MGGSLVASNKYGVFFPRDGFNRASAYGPSDPSLTPNWFYYWQDGDVCGIHSNCRYHPTTLAHGGINPGVDSYVYLGLRAATELSPRTYFAHTGVNLFPARYYPPVTVFANHPKGIRCVAETIRHEELHLDHYEKYRSTPQLQIQHPDGDNDRMPDALEIAGFMGVMTAVNHADTYDLAFRELEYATYGDEEIRCRAHQVNLNVQLFPERDWANPGCQHKNQWGPKVGQ